MTFALRMKQVVAAAVIGTTVISLTGCISMDEHKRLEAAFNQAREQLARAEYDLSVKQKEIDALKAKIAEQDKIINAGLGGVDALRQERDLLAAKLAELQKKYDDLLAASQNPSLPEIVKNKLEDLARMYPDLLEFDKDHNLIRFKSDLTFDLGSTIVKPRAKEALKILAGILNLAEIQGNELRIVGNTDDVPVRKGSSIINNWYLSTNRAHAVREVLSDYDVSGTRIQPAGWGEVRPVAANAANHKGNEKNRRVDIYILPTTVPSTAK